MLRGFSLVSGVPIAPTLASGGEGDMAAPCSMGAKLGWCWCPCCSHEMLKITEKNEEQAKFLSAGWWMTAAPSLVPAEITFTLSLYARFHHGGCNSQRDTGGRATSAHCYSPEALLQGCHR